MKIKILLFFFLTISLTSFSQNSEKGFADIIEKSPEGVFKFYLSEGFGITTIGCAKYYLECKFSKSPFGFEESFNISYGDGQGYLMGNYINGLKEGIFAWYHPNGTISCEGNYTQDHRSGEWRYYYDNGSLRKIIDYVDGHAYLREFYNKNGVKMVENGNGHYLDTAVMNDTRTVIKADGMIAYGGLNGIWKIYIGNDLIGKEYFNDGVFEKGFSYSVMGEEKYTDKFYSSFLDSVWSEEISFYNIRTTCNFVGKVYNANLNNNLGTTLKSRYAAFGSDMEIKDYWFFAGIEFEEDDKTIKNVGIFIDRVDIDKNKLADWIRQCYLSSNKANEFRGNKMLFPVVIMNGKVYLSGDAEFDLLH